MASVVSNTGSKTLDERRFRRIKIFENKGDAWKEWRTHFLTAVRQSSPITAEGLEKVESSDVPGVADEVLKTSQTYQEAIDLQYVVHDRLVSTFDDPWRVVHDRGIGGG